MIQELRPYPDYKNSGVPWLGDVPEHWDLLPNRAIFSEVKDRNHPDEEMLSVTINRGVIKQKALLENSSKKDSSNTDKSAYKLVCPRDIAYNKMRAWQCAIGASELRGIISPAYVVMRLRKDDYNHMYFHHLYRTPQFGKEAERWSYGITSDMWSLRPEHFKIINTPIPPPEEQAAIVRFLDHADRRIRRFIRAKRRMIELLNEQKQAIIHHAVTRGLNPNVRLKPSGVEWLGDVPEHWEVWKLNHIARIGNGSTPSRANSAYWAGGTIPWLSSGVVNDGTVRHAREHVTDKAIAECHLPWVKRGSLIMGLIGQGKTRATTALLDIDATINQNIAYITPDTRLVLSTYLQQILKSMYAHLRMIGGGDGATEGALSCALLSRIRIVLPPIDEQKTIMKYIGAEVESIESGLIKIEREIDLVREYRTRLITDVVTGKLDVRGVAVEAVEEELEELLDAEVEEIDDEMGDDEAAEE